MSELELVKIRHNLFVLKRAKKKSLRNINH